MKRDRHGGFAQYEILYVAAILAILIAIFWSVYSQMAKQAVRAHTPPVPVLQVAAIVTGVIFILFGLMPAVFALPCAAIAQRTRHKFASFSEAFWEYWSKISGGVFVALWIVGIALFLWDKLVSPFIHYLLR